MELEQLEERSLAAASILETPINSGGSKPHGITTGPDGALWFTEFGADRMGRITTGGAVSEFSLPTHNSANYELVSASDGAIWFTESAANKIGRITTSGAVTEYNIPTPSSRPLGIAVGSDGALWFAENTGRKIGRITTSGALTEYALPSPGSEPEEITAGPDGALWFTDSQTSSIGRITTGGTVTMFAVPGSGRSFGSITAGADGALWFTDTNQNQILRMTTSGALSTFTIPTPGSSPVGITAGPDGALWFTESSDSGNAIGRITTAGIITETSIPSQHSQPVDITLGPDGALWFVENHVEQIGRIDPAAVASTIITVDTTSDVVDGVTTSISGLLASVGLDGHVSLREAILAANATPGADEIRFAIPDNDPNHWYYRNDHASGTLSQPVRTTRADSSISDFDPDYPYAGHSWFRIDLNPLLPELQITDHLTIDGYSQPGASQNSLAVGDDATIRIELTSTAVNGNSQLSNNRGLLVAAGAGRSLIRGLAINRFGWSGIMVDPGADGTTVEGNFLGTDVTGTIALGNGDDGIQVRSSNNTIGGSTPASRNLLSGNLNRGLNFFTSSGAASANLVQNNYIGVDATGTRPLGNAAQGVVGHDLANSFILDNVISANGSSGLWFRTSTASGNTVQGNLIGSDASGTLPLGNLGDGVLIDSFAGGEIIGGTAAGQANVIAHNNGIGVNVSSGEGTAILGNAIFGNVGLGIDIRGDGITPNQGNKPPGQPNRRMNFPVIVTAGLNGSNIDVSGYVGLTPNQPLFGGARVEFFATDNDPRNHGQATAYLGFLTTDANGNFSGTIPAGGLGFGDVITAVATDRVNNSSEFAANAVIALTPSLTVSAVPTSVYGQSVTINVSVSGPAGTPTGTVTFAEGSTVLGTVALSGGVADFSIATLPVGVHSITAHYNGEPRYLAVTSAPVTINVTPAPLTVTADGLTSTYGQAHSALTYTYSGLVNADTAAVFHGGLSTTATARSHAGVYAITQGSLSAGSNYTINYSPGTLTVVPAPLAVVAKDAERDYGQPNPHFSAQYVGLVNDDKPDSLGGLLEFSTPATSTSPAGSYAITPGGLSSADYAITFVDGTLTVKPRKLVATGSRVTAVEGVPFSGIVATFTAPDGTPNPAGYSATILWGDGHVSTGLVGFDAARGVYTIEGVNTYQRHGDYDVRVDISAAGTAVATAHGHAVVDDHSITARGTIFLAAEDSPFTRTVATFTSTGPAGGFSATIDWGNGRSSAGVVELDPDSGVFHVVGSSTYTDSGFFLVKVTIRDGQGATTVARSLALVSGTQAPGSLAALGTAVTATEGVPFDGTVGTFTDGDRNGDPGDFRITIDWGDGTSSAGTPAPRGAGQFAALGTHTYAVSGQYTVLIRIQESDGQSATTVSLAVVTGPGAGGGVVDPPVIDGPSVEPDVPVPPSGRPVSAPAAGTLTNPATPTIVPRTAIAGPFLPVLPAVSAPAIAVLAAPPVVPAPIVTSPVVVVTQIGQTAGPAAAAIPFSQSGNQPAPAAVSAAGPAATGSPGTDQATITPVVPPGPGAEAVLADVAGAVGKAWLAAVQAAGDEAGAIASVLGRGPVVPQPRLIRDLRGERVYPKEALWQELDDLDREVSSGALGETFQKVVGATVVAYVGYVLLNSRSLFWLASLLMARPLWKQFDPLEVLLAWEEEERSSGGRDEDETLQSMVADDHPTLDESRGKTHVADQPRPGQPHCQPPARRARARATAGPGRRGPRRAKSAL